MNALLLFCAYMTFVYVPWDFLSKPVAEADPEADVRVQRPESEKRALHRGVPCCSLIRIKASTVSAARPKSVLPRMNWPSTQ